MGNAKVWEGVGLNVRALIMSWNRVRMALKAFEDIPFFYFESSTRESNKIRRVSSKGIVTAIALWNSGSREKVK